MILVCGLPSSGNRLVCDRITRGVNALGTEETVAIWHGERERPQNGLDDPRVAIVIPVRDEAMRKRSVARRVRRAESVLHRDARVCRRHIFALVAEMDLPVYLLSYEGLVADPEASGRDLYEWLGLPWVEWPTEPCDQHATPERGVIYDANAKYRETT